MLNRTINYANKSTCPQRHAAMVCRGNKPLAMATNKYHNDPRQFPTHHFNNNLDMIGIHAEIAAIKQLKPEQVRGATIYIARITKQGKPAMSRPCARCEKALIAAGVRKVIYSDNLLEDTALAA